MKIGYYYATTLLGILEKTDEGYSYTSDTKNEQRLKDALILTSARYGLFNSYKRESKTLFEDFERLLCNLRPDILERAKVSFTYSDKNKVYRPYLNYAVITEPSWEALVKFSALPIFPSGFYPKLMQ